MSRSATPPSLPTIADPVPPQTTPVGPIRFTVVADPTGTVDPTAARVVTASRVTLPLSIVRVFRPAAGEADRPPIVSQQDYEQAMAAAAEQLTVELDRAIAGLGPGRHALAATADFADTFAEPAGVDVIGRPAERVDLTVRVTATVTAVELSDLEQAALAQLATAVPAGLELAPGSMGARVTGALASEACVIYTVEADGLAIPPSSGLLQNIGSSGLPAVAVAESRSIPADVVHPVPTATIAPADEAEPAVDRGWTASRGRIWLARAVGFLIGIAAIAWMMVSRPPP